MLLLKIWKWELLISLVKQKSATSTLLLAAVSVALMLMSFWAIGGPTVTLGTYKQYSVYSDFEGFRQHLIGSVSFFPSNDTEEVDFRALERDGKLCLERVSWRDYAFPLLVQEARDFREKVIDELLSENGSLLPTLRPITLQIIYLEKLDLPAETSVAAGGELDSVATSVSRLLEARAERVEPEVPPAKVSIPFPFDFLIELFTVFAPISLLAVFFAASVYREKVLGAGTYLLASPASSITLICGKMLPYASPAVGSSALLAAILLEAGLTLPILLVLTALTVLLFSSAGIVTVFSRGGEEMNLGVLFLNVVFFAYLFYPAMLRDMSSVAVVSPLIAMLDYSEARIGLAEFIVLVAPIFAGAGVAILLLACLFQDPILFSSASSLERVSLLLADKLERRRDFIPPLALAWGCAAVPFLYILEFLLLFFLLPLGEGFLPAILVLAPVLEEGTKVLAPLLLVRAGLLRKVSSVALVALLTGFGMWFVEKVAALSLVLRYLPPASVSFVLAKVLPLTLLIHCGCAALASLGVTKGRSLWGWLIAAIALHAAYNLIVLWGY